MEQNYEDVLFRIYGYNTFRPQQQEIITTIVEHRRDVCCVMATGYGKSICYQLPAIITGRPSIIVSPLLSLMEDQKNDLERRGIRVCCYNSTLNNYIQAQQEILSGMYSVIYITPEAIVKSRQWLTTLYQTHGISVMHIRSTLV